jgi:hypothetical protein
MYKFRVIKVNNSGNGFYGNERNVAFGDIMCALITYIESKYMVLYSVEFRT